MYEFYFVGCEMTTYIGKYLNPGEIHDILQNERCGRRKARLKQVRSSGSDENVL